MSAPETPGVVSAISVRSASPGSGTWRVDLEDGLAPAFVRQINDHAAIEPARPQQRPVESVGLVSRGKHDHPFAAREAVHLRQDLVEGLLLLAGTANHCVATCAANGVDLIDEDDGWRMLTHLLEQVADARGAHPTIISTNSDPLIETNRTSASPATARASNVLPVPAALTRSTPFGAVPPRRVYFSGFLRKSTISTISFSASSIPATSSKEELKVLSSPIVDRRLHVVCAV
jgi:hypothetical protein